MAEAFSVNISYLSYFENRYGDQSLFRTRSEEVIHDGIDFVQKELSKGTAPENIYPLFSRLLTDRRGALAKEQGSKDAEYFGFFRNEDEIGTYTTHYTIIRGREQLYGNSAINRLGKIMRKMEMVEGIRLAKMDSESSYKGFGRRWALSIKVLDPKPGGNFVPISKDESFPDYMHQYLDHERLRCPNRLDALRFYREEPALTERYRISALMIEIFKRFPSPSPELLRIRRLTGISVKGEENLKSKYLQASLAMEVDGKMVPLAIFFTWMYETNFDCPIEWMKGRSVLHVSHQEITHHEITTVVLSRIFAQIVTWKGSGRSLEDLQKDIAHFRYIYALHMPCARGDGTKGDWAERIFYNLNGYELHNTKEPFFAYEPFAAPVPGYYEQDYLKSREIRPLASSV